MQSSLVRVLVVAVVALGVLAGAALATESGRSRKAEAVINACTTKAGKIRIVADASVCKRNETALKWNVSGPKGDQGPKGDSGVAHLHVVNRQGPWADVPVGAIMTASAHCQANEVATGGGPVAMDPNMVLMSSNAAEVPTPTSWRVTVKNNGGMEHSFSVEVVCATS